jgi:UDP-glucose 4-epimerase
MIVLITGGLGFLGRHIVDRLFANTAVGEIIIVDNQDPICGSDDNHNIRFCVGGDVSSYKSIADIIEKYQVTHVIHLAAYGRNLSCESFPLQAWQTNVMGTINILEAARLNNVKRVVCCSSNIVLCPDQTIYKSTKQALELAVLSYQRYGLSVQGLRPCNIYGVGQSKTEYQMCSFAALDAYYKEHGCFKIDGDGTQTRDWVHAQDVAGAFIDTLFSNITTEALDIATGHLTSMNEVATMLGVPVVYGPRRIGDAMTIISNPQLTKRVLGWEYSIELKDRIWDAFPSVKR